MKSEIKLIILTTHFLLPVLLSSQTLTQSIRGVVTDAATREPLIGANILVTDLEKFTGTATDIDGTFVIEKVPVGRHTIRCSYTGYETSEEILLLNSAKEGVLDFILSEGALGLDVVVVKAPVDAINPLSMLSVRSVSPEETQYYPAAVNDIGRSMLSMPGVQPTKDNENDVIIRGNSSTGLLWRLEGIDILNPNHFARKGSSGGGITIFSLSMMNESDFSTGAFPAEYGNAMAGVFDMRFRDGNRQQREYTFRTSMLGLDLAAEGPFKENGASYLFNYRYSTLGILNELGLHLVGERVDNNFQDFSFNLFFPGKNDRFTFKIWGVGGLSEEKEAIVDDVQNWEQFSDSTRTQAESGMGVAGATYILRLTPKSYWKTTAAVMAQRTLDEEIVVDRAGNTRRIKEEDYLQGRVSLASSYSKSFNNAVYLKAGFQLAGIHYDEQYDTIAPDESYRQIVDGKGTTLLAQPYFQVQLTPSPKWTFNIGLHAMYFHLTKSIAIEPRLALQYKLKKNQTLSLAYGIHSQYVPLGSYFTVVDGNQPNLDLDLIKAHHFILAWDRTFASQFRLHSELYYQYLFDVPVGTNAPRTYWMFNDIEGFADEPLVSKGTGQNYGLDIILEKFFQRGTFFVLSSSIFNSTFVPLDGKTYDTQYNSHFIAAFTSGKEWEFSSKNTALQLAFKAVYNHGMPATPLTQTDGRGPHPVHDETQVFSEKAPSYFRVDTRIAFRKNRPSSYWMLALDVQNTTNQRNKRAFGWSYNVETKSWSRKNQASMIPVLSFQLDF
jgi:carboxypeptidase-like protein